MVRIDSKYIRFWSELTAEERRRLSIQMFSLFPQVLGPGSSDKYNPVSMWLVTTKQIINIQYQAIILIINQEMKNTK